MEEAIINKILLKRKLAVATAILMLKLKKQNRKRRWQVNPNNRREGNGENLIKELRLSSKQHFFSCTRLNLKQFDILLSMVKDKLTKNNNFRQPISPEIRLAVTLRHLATGDSLPTLADVFQVGKSTACNMIKQTCDILWETLSPVYLRVPTRDEWVKIADDFETQWDLPHCLGAIDAKHVVIQTPHKSNTLDQNSNIVLFATCDTDYKFTYVDIGSYSAHGNGGVLRESQFGNKLFKGELNTPPDNYIKNTGIRLPYYFVADEVFPLHRCIHRPYKETREANVDRENRIYNYRLTRAFQCIENTFGILVSRFGIFHKVMNAHPETVCSIIKATICLHNFIRNAEMSASNSRYCPATYVDKYEKDGNIIPGDWRSNTPKNSALDSARGLPRRIGARNATREAEGYRDTLKKYFNSPIGAVPCQEYLIL